MANRQTRLTTALRRFINNGIAARDRLARGDSADIQLWPGVDEFAGILMELPSAKSAFCKR
jgi:hypothetical protein